MASPMQMPGRQRMRAPSLNIYTGLMLCALACLITAAVLAGQAAMKVGPKGGTMNALKLHPATGSLQLND